jgi:putative copper export protein
MTTVGSVLRWIHILAGAAWLGSVVMVVFVLVPSLLRIGDQRRAWFLSTVFPRVFKLASVLSVTVIAAGLGLYLERFNWRPRLDPLVSSRWGWAILVGGGLGLLLTIFHFFAESRLAPQVKKARAEPVDSRVYTVLRIAPRIGLAILTTVIILMAYAARGL